VPAITTRPLRRDDVTADRRSNQGRPKFALQRPRAGLHRAARGGSQMDIGLFLMPSHPPERGLREGNEWDLQVLRWADEYGFKEAWVGEHHTCK
jgi:hypothetical protein